MKTFLLYVGGFLCMALLACGVFLGTIAYLKYLPIALAKEQQEHEEKAGEEVIQPQPQSPQAQQEQRAQQIQQQAQQAQAWKKQNDAFLASPSLFVDPEGYKTENNWIATMIGREIGEMAFVADHPDKPLPDLIVKATVDPAKPSVHVDVDWFGDVEKAQVSTDPTPIFAWDSQAYAPLARSLLGTTSGLPPEPVTDATDILTHLLTPTGSVLAGEDVRLSRDLQQHPTSWQDHEAAALLLATLALRENAGTLTDERVLLNRATAHLALAQALRGDTPATWPGLIADASIRTLVGRGADAQAHLDTLAARKDCPAPAKPWMLALRLIATQDWRLADVTSASPLLLKIAWFQVLTDDLPNTLATHRLDQVVSQDELQLPDWGRAVLLQQSDLSEKNGQRFTQDNMDRELNDLDGALKAEGSAPVDRNNLAATFTEGESPTVSQDASGKVLVHVIGTGSFKAATRRQLFAALSPIYEWIKDVDSGDDQAEAFMSQMRIVFKGVPQFELFGYFIGKEADLQKTVGQWQTEKKTWPITEVAAANCVSFQLPGNDFAKGFYSSAPFGTTYPMRSNLPSRDSVAVTSPLLDYNLRILQSVEVRDFLSPADREMLLRKEASLYPDAYFFLAEFLRSQGKDDEAAAMDRKGAAEAYDPFDISASLFDLVDYDLNHGLKDEALDLAKKTSDIGSERGLETYCYALQKLGRLDEAEAVAQDLQQGYGDDSWLQSLHVEHPEHYPDEFAKAKQEAFPNGLVRASLNSFSAKPRTGCLIGGGSSLRLDAAHLSPGDVIVALDGYKVESANQYDFVRDLSNDDHMDFIVWRNGKYLEIKTYLSARRLFAYCYDYPVN